MILCRWFEPRKWLTCHSSHVVRRQDGTAGPTQADQPEVGQEAGQRLMLGWSSVVSGGQRLGSLLLSFLLSRNHQSPVYLM